MRARLARGSATFRSLPPRHDILYAVGNVTIPGLLLSLVVAARGEGFTGGEVGLLIAALGGSIFVGANLSGPARKRFAPRTIALAEFYLALGVVLFLVGPNVLVLAAAIVLQGLALAITGSVVHGYRIARTPDHLRSRRIGALAARANCATSRASARGLPDLGVLRPHERRRLRSALRGPRRRRDTEQGPARAAQCWVTNPGLPGCNRTALAVGSRCAVDTLCRTHMCATPEANPAGVARRPRSVVCVHRDAARPELRRRLDGEARVASRSRRRLRQRPLRPAAGRRDRRSALGAAHRARPCLSRVRRAAPGRERRRGAPCRAGRRPAGLARPPCRRDPAHAAGCRLAPPAGRP